MFVSSDSCSKQRVNEAAPHTQARLLSCPGKGGWEGGVKPCSLPAVNMYKPKDISQALSGFCLCYSYIQALLRQLKPLIPYFSPRALQGDVVVHGRSTQMLLQYIQIRCNANGWDSPHKLALMVKLLFLLTQRAVEYNTGKKKKKRKTNKNKLPAVCKSH